MHGLDLNEYLDTREIELRHKELREHGRDLAVAREPANEENTGGKRRSHGESETISQVEAIHYCS